MEHMLELALHNIMSPMILFFILGCFAGFIKSDLEIPDILAKSFALYLVASIGIQGGIKLAEHGVGEDIYALIGYVVVGCALIPFLGYGLLRLTSRLDQLNAAVLAAHYGSVSLVTFVACAEFLHDTGLQYAGWMIALLAIMETPAILSGLFLAQKIGDDAEPKKLLVILREVFLNGTVVLLLGAMAIGYVTTGGDQIQPVKSFFIDPFKGVLCFFLLDMGLVIGRRTSVIKKLPLTVLLYGLYMPFIGAAIGLLIAHISHLPLAETVLLMTLFSSGSYIAVPATMKIAVPKADPAIYMTLPLGITFPMNIIIGIPIYYGIAKMFMA